MPIVAELIEEAMARRGYSQQRLAREAGVTAAWVNMILRRRRAPGAEALLRIADCLGIDRGRIVRAAHYERADDAWKPYLDEETVANRSRAEAGSLPVIGTVCAGPAPGGAGAQPPADPGEVDLARRPAPGTADSRAGAWQNGSVRAEESPADYSASAPSVGFHPDCKAIRVSGDSLEPVAYDGQYVVVSPSVRKENIPDGSICYVTYELPGERRPRAAVKRMYRQRVAGERPEEAGLPVYVFTPVNTRLRAPSPSPDRGFQPRLSTPRSQREQVGASRRAGAGPRAAGSRASAKRLRRPELGAKARLRRPYEALALRHRQVREMYPVVGVIFEGAGPPRPDGGD
jgi:transcriptional regulator with XRE-family HTH domain